jgi:conjugative transfer region protein TrbK
MDIAIFARDVAYVVLGGALVAAAIALNNRQYQAPGAFQSEASSGVSVFDAELARCKAMGAGAANDTVCKAVWENNRERFLGSGKIYHDRVTDGVRATSRLNEPASLSGEDLSRSAPQRPTPPNPSPARAPADTLGQPQ